MVLLCTCITWNAFAYLTRCAGQPKCIQNHRHYLGCAVTSSVMFFSLWYSFRLLRCCVICTSITLYSFSLSFHSFRFSFPLLSTRTEGSHTWRIGKLLLVCLAHVQRRKLREQGGRSCLWEFRWIAVEKSRCSGQDGAVNGEGAETAMIEFFGGSSSFYIPP